MDVIKTLEKRRSIKWFDKSHRVSDEELKALLQPVLLAPTSFNLQHWRFVCIRDKGVQERLCEASWGQRQVADCSVAIVICAKLGAHEDARTVWDGAPAHVVDNMAEMITTFYGADGTLQRDEAIRSGGIASMALMLIATELGYETCPMIGFDPAKVREILRIPSDHISVLMLCVGRGVSEAHPRVGRFDVSEVVRLESFDGPCPE